MTLHRKLDSAEIDDALHRLGHLIQPLPQGLGRRDLLHSQSSCKELFVLPEGPDRLEVVLALAKQPQIVAKHISSGNPSARRRLGHSGAQRGKAIDGRAMPELEV
ncbi:hypothetical protein RW64_09240 [Geobacter sulfurreducens]|nr:hypothetical protein RW64_09240 [Geobacter sulfurreducens]